MLKSDYAILLSNLFVIGALLSWNFLSLICLTFLAFCWFISAIFTLHLEKKQFLRLRAEIEAYNKAMEKHFKNERKRR